MTEPVESFLAFLGVITEAARRGYGSDDVIVDLFLRPGGTPDEEPALHIRLIGPGPHLQSAEAEWTVKPTELRSYAGGAAEYLANRVELLGRMLREGPADA